MPVRHHVPISDGLHTCVALRATTDCVEVLLARSQHHPPNHVCSLPQTVDQLTLSSKFSHNITDEQISSMANLIFSIDGHSKRLFSKNEIIVKKVPHINPPSLTVSTKTPRISEYRECRLSSADLVRPILLSSPDLTALRPFQITGVDWLLNNARAILADDMGLGKTIQSIMALKILFNSGVIHSALILCPKSLLANWEVELSRWAPELSRIKVTPPTKIRDQAWNTILNRVHIILSNYEQLRNVPARLIDIGVDLVIADEAHRIRNIESRVANGVRLLKSRYFWALTGTPIERDPEDLLTLLSTLEPGRFSIKDRSLHPSSMRAHAREFILRRLKTEVLSELPDVLNSHEVLNLLPRQRASYDNVLFMLRNTTTSGVLAAINELRAICDCDETSGQSIKVDRIVEILQDISQIGEKAVVFSYLLTPLDILEKRLIKSLGRRSFVNLRGAMDLSERDEALAAFKNQSDVTAFLCSSRVGGEGLTLTEANHVIFLNRWWNPSANLQAKDRVVRIGQKRGVRVYNFTCKGTIEEDLDEILKEKSDMTYDLIDRLATSKDIHLDSNVLISKLYTRLLSQTV